MMTTNGQRGEDTAPSTGIVPASPQTRRPGQGLLWFVGIALSVTVMSRHPYLGVACLAMGLRVQLRRFGAKGMALGAGIAVAMLAGMTFVYGVSSSLFAVPLIGIPVVLVALMNKRHASVTAVSLLVAVFTALMMACDAYEAAQHGLTLASATTSILMDAGAYSLGEGLSAQLTLTSLKPVFEAIWPMTYVLTALSDVVVAGFGSFIGAAQRPDRWGSVPATGARVNVPQISRFDVPLWTVGVLALSVLGLGVSFVEMPAAELIRTASLTLLLSDCILFTVQGFGVVLGLMDRWRVGCFGRMVVIMLAVWLGMMLIVSIIGLIDVWANFRGLPRRGAHAEAHT